MCLLKIDCQYVDWIFVRIFANKYKHIDTMNYPTNVTDNQWSYVKKLLPNCSRKRKYSLREILDAILYLVKTGCQWRMIPSDFPAWNTVYYYFSTWKRDGTIEYIMRMLHRDVREQAGRDPEPSTCIIDSRSVKTSHHTDKIKGIDGNKRIKGRKEHIAVDTLGFPIGIAVHEANVYDAIGAELVLDDMVGRSDRLHTILADGGYRGNRLKALAKAKGWNLKVVLRPEESSRKFQVVPLRWIVERSFSWLENFRRLSIDHEFLAESSLAMIQLAFIKLLLNRLPF